MARYIDVDFVEYLIDHYGGMVTWNKKEILGEIRKQVQIHSTADVVPKSEVERLETELEDKQFRCDSCDRIMLTGAEHRACVKQAKAEVAREIFDEFTKHKVCTNEEDFRVLDELKKKYIGEK